MQSHEYLNICQKYVYSFLDLQKGVLGFWGFGVLGFFLFDCWIGNTDRHHENWGLIRNNLYSDEESFAITPAYDHGAALCSSLLPGDGRGPRR